MLAVEERFWPKVDKGGPDECWTWTAANSHGYGYIKVDGRMQRAHRIAFEMLEGPIPDGLDLDHLCHTEAAHDGECPGGPTCPHRACVNPAHLEPVDPEENYRRGIRPNTLKTHCPKGHPYDEENTYVDKLGKRSCRACHRKRQEKYNARRRGAKC